MSKHEQIFDALERGAVTPKTAEQMGQQLKGIVGLANLELRFVTLIQKMGKKAVVPRNPLMRDVLGLPEAISPSDGAQMRRLAAAE